MREEAGEQDAAFESVCANPCLHLIAIAEIEESARGGDKIVISELPYQVGPNSVLAKIKELVATKEIEGISDANEESSGNDTRIVITLKRDSIRG